jgi:hypothetical protein
MDIGKTERGFRKAEFIDHYGEGCSVQESSLATEAAIWLGIDSPKPQLMARDAPEEWLAPPDDPERHNGWVQVPLPEGTLLTGRMHLTQEQVRELLPVLEHFAHTGSLPDAV